MTRMAVTPAMSSDRIEVTRDEIAVWSNRPFSQETLFDAEAS
jgi:hypothetical protein